ncbi:MAG: MFS transporter [Clostridiales bacterium]|nr:MFS transporter [Clostridiales bacterium]
MKKVRERFTKREKSWILYDWANSVYATNIMAAIFPIYFVAVAGESGDQWWGIGTSIATFAVALMAPLLGAVGDYRGMKKKLFAVFLALGVVFTTAMAFTDQWQWMLVGYVLSRIGFTGTPLLADDHITERTGRFSFKFHSFSGMTGFIGDSWINKRISEFFSFGSNITSQGISTVSCCPNKLFLLLF